MIELIGPRGLGDAIFVRAVAQRWLDLGERVSVFTDWPSVFDGLAVTIKTTASRTGEENIFHCVSCAHCRLPDVIPVSMFRRICHQSGLFDPFEFRIDWTVQKPDMVKKLKRRANGRKILIYQPPKIANGFEQSLFNPRPEDFLKYLDDHDGWFRVKVGDPRFAHKFPEAPCEYDLFGNTSVADIFDIATVGDLFFSQVCYLVTLGEAMGKNVACMFTKRALTAGAVRVRQITPEMYFENRHLVEVLRVA